MIGVTLASYIVRVNPIVGEVAYSLIISSSSKFINVIGEDLPNTFNEVQNSNLPAGPLHDPNSHSVRFGPSSTNVKEGSVGKQGVGSDTTNSTLGFGLSQDFSKVSAFDSTVFPFPDMRIVIWVLLQIGETFFFEDCV